MTREHPFITKTSQNTDVLLTSDTKVKVISSHTIEFDVLFQDSLQFIWNEISKLVKLGSFSGNKANSELHSNKMRKLALDFYNKFKDTPIPIEKNNWIFNNFDSVSISLKDGTKFLIPFFFYQHASLEMEDNFTTVFAKHVGWSILIINFMEISSKFIFQLKQADGKILSAIVHNKTNGLFNIPDSSNKAIFIHFNNLASITGLSVKWASSRLNFLIDNLILQPLYIINPFLFGLHVYLLKYENEFDIGSQISELDKFTLSKFQIDFNHLIRIIQIPYKSKEDIIFSFPVDIKTIDEMQLSINLADVSSKTIDNFKKFPNLDSNESHNIDDIIVFKRKSMNWSKVLTFSDQSKYSFLKSLNFIDRVSIILKVLEYLSNHNAIQQKLFISMSNDIGISVTELMETIRFLIDYNMVAFFPKIERIGCNNKYSILITDHGTNQDLMQKIHQNLLKLPLCISFFSKNSIFAYINIPDKFVTPFLKYIATLQDSIDISCSLLIPLKNWIRLSIPLPGIRVEEKGGVSFE